MDDFNNIITAVIVTIVITIGIFFLYNHSTSDIDPFGKTSECVQSRYNPANMSTGYARTWDNCYYPVYHYYQSKEKCGTLGFVCYESSESYTKVFVTDGCFNIRTGKRC